MSETPLHVRVALALGFPPRPQPCDDIDGGWHFDSAMGSGKDFDPNFSPTWRDLYDYGEWHMCSHELNLIFRYDEEWGALGPLVEEFKLAVEPIDSPVTDRLWVAWKRCPGDDVRVAMTAADPRLALCELILALHRIGRLR